MSQNNHNEIIKIQIIVTVLAISGAALALGLAFAAKLLIACLLITINLILWSYLIEKMTKAEQIPKLKLVVVFLLKMFLLFGGFWALYAPLHFPPLALMVGVATLPLAAIVKGLKF